MQILLFSILAVFVILFSIAALLTFVVAIGDFIEIAQGNPSL